MSRPSFLNWLTPRPDIPWPRPGPGAHARPVTRPPAAALPFLALGVVYVVWGSTYLAIRFVIETMPPLLSAGLRFATAGLLLAGILAVVKGPSVLRLTRPQLASAALLGLLLPACGNGLVVIAEQKVPSGLA